jgi:general secretion pathway protein K
MLAAALVAMSRSDARNATLDQERLQADETVMAAIGLAIVALSDPTQHLPLDGTAQTITFDGAQVTVGIAAESGKIDLNNGNPDLISGLLTIAGEGPGTADTLAQAIVEHRQVAPFTSLAELLHMPSMTPELLDRIAPSLTLYSGSSSVDAKLAPMDVLLAIPGNTSADAEAEMARRSTSSGSVDGPAIPVIAGQAFSISGQLTGNVQLRASSRAIRRASCAAAAPPVRLPSTGRPSERLLVSVAVIAE